MYREMKKRNLVDLHTKLAAETDIFADWVISLKI